MNVLVINSGSSSIKFSLYRLGAGAPSSAYDGEISGIGAEAKLVFKDEDGGLDLGERKVNASTAGDAVREVEGVVTDARLPKIEAVGYRVVHPGAKLTGHQRITVDVMKELKKAREFAPLHDPVTVEIIEEMMARLPNVEHYACFDTVFHETMPEVATTYAIPKEYREQGVRRYGFHGLSCESVVARMKEVGSLPVRMVIAHLGSGCSVTALVEGKSVDTSMGLTPTGGVVMGTRPGDLDPGLMIYLLRQQPGDAVEEVEGMLNHKAGMAALSEMANDMKSVRKAAEDGNAAARMAIEVFVRSVRKAIGGYAFLMGGLDAVVFTGGIGEHDAATRAESLSGLGGWGIELDLKANAAKMDDLTRVSADGATTCVYVCPAREDLMIAQHVGELMR